METLIATLIAALNQHIDARIKVALADHSPEIDMDALRELVKPLIDSVVEQAIEDHCEGYDHDSYDNAVNKLDDLPNLDNLEDSVKDVIRYLTFEVSVS